MAPKRVSPLDEAPTASSSEVEESSSEEIETSSDDDDDEPSKPQSPIPPISAEKKSKSKTPPAAPTTTSTISSKPQSKASSSDSETESDSESETDEDRPDPKIKPISSKPIEETSKSKKSTATPARSMTKRPSENDRAVSDSKRAKKGKDVAAAPAAEDDGTKAKADSKKLFQRIWSDDDEIALLNGMLEFSRKTGGIPYKDLNAFHDFIKEALHADMSNDQLSSKIRRLKKKYENIKKKRNTGKEYNPSKPHEKKAYELSKKVWATAEEEEENGGTEMPKPQSKGKEKKNQNQKSRNNIDSDDKNAVATSSMSLAETILFERTPGLSLFDGETIKKSFKLIEASKRAELEDQWKKLQIAELEMFVRRSELVKEQTALIWEAYKSSTK